MGYELETGLADDFDLEITNAHFAYSEKLARDGEPRIALHLEGKAEGGTYDSPTVIADDSALLFAIGDKWMITDDGAKVVDQGGRDRGWNVKSAAGRLQTSAMKAGVPLKDRGDAQEAKIWIGLKVHFKRHSEDFGGDIGKKDVLAIEKYYGAGEGGTKTATKTDTKTEKAPAGDDVTAIKDAVGGAIFKRLEKLAATAEDYDTWASEAADLPKVADNDAVQDIILHDERGKKVYEQLKG